MHKIRSFYYQNKDKIIKGVLIVAFVIIIIQLLNLFTKIDSNKKIEESKMMANNKVISSNVTSSPVVSNKSAISGEAVPSTKLENDTDVIKQFLEYCNNGDAENAYMLLSDDCKKSLYPNVQEFKKNYLDVMFLGNKKLYTIENWTGSIYKVEVTEDIISTGKLDNINKKLDYITTIKENSDYKLNINRFIECKKINKTTTNKDISITVESKNVYMDYEEYNIQISNNSDKKIAFDKGDSTESIYLIDNKNVKYYFYSNEIAKSSLVIQSGFKTNIQIKFNSSYNSSRKIEKIIFSEMLLDYNDSENIYQFSVQL